jgi:hypothetical protein
VEYGERDGLLVFSDPKPDLGVHLELLVRATVTKMTQLWDNLEVS